MGRTLLNRRRVRPGLTREEEAELYIGRYRECYVLGVFDLGQFERAVERELRIVYGLPPRIEAMDLVDGRFVVVDGDETDPCPLCGIHRRYAGHTPESCGENFQRPGGFVNRDRDAVGFPPIA